MLVKGVLRLCPCKTSILLRSLGVPCWICWSCVFKVKLVGVVDGEMER